MPFRLPFYFSLRIDQRSLIQYSKYKTWTSPASGISPTPHAAKPVHTGAGKQSNSPAANNKAPIEAKPHPDALTSGLGEMREKVEPGRDVFEAHPIDQVNESLEAALTKTGAHAPVDPEAKKKLDDDLKRKEAARKSAQEEVAKLAEEVGPLLPSDLAKVEEERKKEKDSQDAPVGVQMIQEGEKLKKQLERQKKEAEE